VSVLVYEIPVYSMPEEVFVDKYSKRFEDLRGAELLKQVNYPKGVWHFNQIIGYVTVSVDEFDILIDVYKHIGRIYPFSGRKRLFQNLYCNGLHFRKIGLSNEEISMRICKMLRDISIEHFKGRYIDTRVLNNTIRFIDFQTITEV